MIFAIEGVTCAGKTTLMNELLRNNPRLQAAPEHTPLPPKEGEDMLARQERVFQNFLEHFLALDRAEQLYLGDYSPLGCAAFSMALGRVLHQEAYYHQGTRFIEECRKNNIRVWKYLPAIPAIIWQRLHERARNTDNAWTPELVAALCYEYDLLFKVDLYDMDPLNIFKRN